MKRRAFTLVELLGVIIILSILALVTFPPILNQIKKSKNNISKATETLLFSAAGLYIDENQNMYGYVSGDTYCFTLQSLVEDGKLVKPIKNSSNEELDYNMQIKGTVLSGKEIKYSLVESGKCNINNNTPGIPDEPDVIPTEDLTPPEILYDDGSGNPKPISDIIITPGSSFDAREGIIIRDNLDGNISLDKLTIVGTVTPAIRGSYKLIYKVSDSNGNMKTVERTVGVTVESREYVYTGKYQTFKADVSGIYHVELSGASGGSYGSSLSGNGASTTGDIYLEKGTVFYVYVGGSTSSTTGGWNGGGNGYRYGMGGGGSTDIRTVNTSSDTLWNDFTSLKSRIMVAAGGAGGSQHDTGSWLSNGGDGGTITGGAGSGGWASNVYAGTVATQSYGGISYGLYKAQDGSFGKGGNSYAANGGWSAAGGGGGYYGGAGGSYAGGNAGGGSSYISGYEGCSSIAQSSTATDIIRNGYSLHYTNNYFTNSKMIAGNNTGNGSAKITLIEMRKNNNIEIAKTATDNFYFQYGNGYSVLNINKTGKYQIKLYGAQGGRYEYAYGGKGGYAEGEIFLTKGTKLYIYAGGVSTYTTGGWNGGGNGYGNGQGGGGSTDIRLVSTSNVTAWNEFDSLKSRIMVAAGGAGGSQHNTTDWLSNGGAGGGLNGSTGTGGTTALFYSGTGATQTSGGLAHPTYAASNGVFGKGGNSYQASWSSAGGGGGYYGGAGASHAGGFATGGSSYISGLNGCSSINEDSTATNIISNGSPIHYSNKVFSNASTDSNVNEGVGQAIIKLVEETNNDNTQIVDSEKYSYNIDYSGSYSLLTIEKSGIYNVKLWGAQGGTYYSGKGGKGGYTEGNIYLTKGTKLYIYVGKQANTTAGGWNGGGNGYNAGYGGGGATDIRLVPTSSLNSWNEFDSLKSRIMVAAGGAGGSQYDTGAWLALGGAGGGINGGEGTGGSESIRYRSLGATQTAGGGFAPDSYTNLGGTYGGIGQFGIGGNSYAGNGAYSAGGGGGGYYGGTGGAHAGGSASGGSSYISGMLGCASIQESSTSTNIISSGSPIHYSGYAFDSTKTEGNVKEGNGYAQITLVEAKDTNTIVINDTNNYSYAIAYSGKYAKIDIKKSGYYNIELWGAQGGIYQEAIGGKGGYTNGEIHLKKGTTLYVYVGGKATSTAGGWNGGGNGYSAGFGGGGATDIRLITTSSSNAWNEFDSLKSRIMVAAGGAGGAKQDTATWFSLGGAGGGLIGLTGNGGSNSLFYKGTGAIPTFGGIACSYVYPGSNGTFGRGGNSYQATWSTAGGGGGYFGGAGGSYAGGNATGGSSYASGMVGSVSLDKNATATNLINSGKSVHYSGYKFYNATTTSDVREGNGYAKITFVRASETDTEITLDQEKYSYDFIYSGNYTTIEIEKSGNYKFELWGAAGGTYQNATGGRGGYTTGEVYLEQGMLLYVYVGQKPYSTVGGWNGGGNGYRYGFGGGGATDVRLVKTANSTTWNDFDSLKSRIMVAAGGAGGSQYDAATWLSNGGAGGGLTGLSGSGGSAALTYKGTGATQISGGIPSTTYPGGKGAFGIGGNSCTASGDWSSGGGGGGYYGGAGGSYAGGPGTGGSSYISGFTDCNAITSTSTTSSIVHTGSSTHYSGIVFKNASTTSDVNSDYGRAKITYIGQ